MQPIAVQEVVGGGNLQHLESLTAMPSGGSSAHVSMVSAVYGNTNAGSSARDADDLSRRFRKDANDSSTAAPPVMAYSPSANASNQPTEFTLDFGREVSGRVRLVSASDHAAVVETSYGESPEEAHDHGYLGTRLVTVPAHATAYGPKSAFRYVRLSFPKDAPPSRWAAIDVEGITYPVTYQGSFENSDPLLNRIWEPAAYTARLCMQEGIWDAPKRDRGRWMGDLDVTGRTIAAVFGERALMEQTMADVIGEPPVTRDMNTIAGYSALWVTGQANFYRHTGDLAYLRRMQPRLLGLLAMMDAELGPDGLFTNPNKHKVFVDSSAGFSADTPEARAATHFEFAPPAGGAGLDAHLLGRHAGGGRDQLLGGIRSALAEGGFPRVFGGR
jgi:alpha-L-rhamnosidase